MNNDKNKKLWLEKVEKTMKIGGKSSATFSNYRSKILKFLNFYNNDVIISKIKDEDIASYVFDNYVKINKSANTVNVSVCSIRFLYSVCFKREINRRILPNSKIKKRIPTIISKDEFLLILNNESNLKHKCWLLLAFCSGLRVDEVANVKIENIYSKEHKLKVLGKGNKERFTILPDVVIKFLRLYYKSSKSNSKTGNLFKCANRSAMNTKTIVNYFTSIKMKYKLNDNITFHSLRHSFATYYLINGGNILTLKSMLGHTHLGTTGIYVHISLNFNEIEGIKYV
ncbi:MAG: tyrosine-type recombinase/integrase [Clostridia bacterium]